VAALSARQGSAKFRKVYLPTAFLPPAYSKSKNEETRMSQQCQEQDQKQLHLQLDPQLDPLPKYC
jgi:hypothetical protein